MLGSYKIFSLSHRELNVSLLKHAMLQSDTKDQLQASLLEFKRTCSSDELMYLSTCNRVEYIFCSNKKLEELKSSLRTFLIAQGKDAEAVDHVLGEMICLEGAEAVKHHLRVASSMESMVIGEREIWRQLREAYEQAVEWNLSGDGLRILHRFTTKVAKDIYTNTKIGSKTVSVVSLAMKMLSEKSLPENPRFLLISAGSTIQLVLKFLEQYPNSDIHVFNRSLAKAEKDLEAFNCHVHPLEELRSFSQGFDVIIASSGRNGHILDADTYQQLVQGDEGEKIIIDLAIPHDIDEQIVLDYNVDYTSIEDLRTIAQENIAFRKGEVLKAQKIVAKSLSEFNDRVHERFIERALGDLPVMLQDVKRKALEEVFAKDIADQNEEVQELIGRIADYMEKKFTGIPMKTAKQNYMQMRKHLQAVQEGKYKS